MAEFTEAGIRLTDEGADVLWEVDDDRKVVNQQRAGRLGHPPCEHCGNPVKPGSGWLIVVAAGGSALVHTDDTFKAEAMTYTGGERPEGVTADEADQFSRGYMGAYLVGPRCGTKFPKDYRTKDTGEVFHR